MRKRERWYRSVVIRLIQWMTEFMGKGTQSKLWLPIRNGGLAVGIEAVVVLQPVPTGMNPMAV